MFHCLFHLIVWHIDLSMWVSGTQVTLLKLLVHKNNITLVNKYMRYGWDKLSLIWLLILPFCERLCDWIAVTTVLSAPVMAWSKLASTSCGWMAGLSRRGRMFNDRDVPSVVTRSVQVCLMEQTAESSHQALLDSPQRLALVFISGPSCLALHLLICRLGAAHCGKPREIWIEISYFILEQPNYPFSFPFRLFSHIVPAILYHLSHSSFPPASERCTVPLLSSPPFGGFLPRLSVSLPPHISVRKGERISPR